MRCSTELATKPQGKPATDRKVVAGLLVWLPGFQNATTNWIPTRSLVRKQRRA